MLDLQNTIIHFIGIGGVSMSALAQYSHKLGAKVSGSDITDSPLIHKLKNLGIPINIGHDLSLVTDCQLCVYTSAINQTNVEYCYCINNNIKLFKREEFLSLILNSYSNSIAISGSHGKTTTTAMIYNALIACSINPTLFIGGNISGVGNFHLSDNDYAVFEACEYKRSFLKFTPKVCVILNIEADHLDYYKNFNDVSSAFNQFASQTILDGKVVASMQAAKYLQTDNITIYGMDKNCHVYADNITSALGKYSFDIIDNDIYIGRCNLSIVGYVNIYNALAAYCACKFFKLNKNLIIEGLAGFKGVERRFQTITCDFCHAVADYAHHPTEITELINTAKQLGHKRIIAVFQSHTYTRTAALLDEFALSLSIADIVILTPIYAAREKPNGVTSETLADKINEISANAFNTDSFESAVELLKNISNPDDLILIIGAGDIIDICPMLAKNN